MEITCETNDYDTSFTDTFAISSGDQWKLLAVNYISLLLVVTSGDYLYLMVNYFQ